MMVVPEEYCTRCGEVTPSELRRGLGIVFVYCARCHGFIELIELDDEE